MKVTLYLDGRTESGGSALVMHNERLADPLDSFTQAIAAVSKKRNKALTDHEEIAHLEFLGGLYTNPPIDYPLNGVKPAPCIPAWNVLRCLQDGAKKIKRGMDVPRGIRPLKEQATLSYNGPKDPEALWQEGGFTLRKSVGIQRSRTMRTRPIFVDWQAELPIEVDSTVFDIAVLQQCWKIAGSYAGLGEMRPIYGSFAATLKEA